MSKSASIVRLVAVTGAAAIISISTAEPAFAADNPQSCTSVGTSATLCQSPGNAQLDDAPPVPQASQYPLWAGLLLFHHAGTRH
ncbi:hypothetical protein AWB94_10750 [Mycolicibacterium canariasense]|nr:hypothetical protein AWB94_10750 [Mycolicibacterium canariasense]